MNPHPLIGKKFSLHEHGWIELIDFMGSDLAIAEAAWVSTEGAVTKKSPVPQFLDYLMRHGHWSPFEMCELKFRVMLPIAVEGQWVTHRTAAKNQASARYTKLPEVNYTPKVWRAGSTGHNKQGSSGVIAQPEEADRIYSDLVAHARSAEAKLRELGVAPELARFAELNSQYTMKVWKMDLRNLMGFLRQRTEGHAQEEIRVYADIIEHIASELFPEAMHAWKNHVKYAVTFSREEQEALAFLLKERIDYEADLIETDDRMVATASLLKQQPGGGERRASQQAELLAKIKRVLEVA